MAGLVLRGVFVLLVDDVPSLLIADVEVSSRDRNTPTHHRFEVELAVAGAVINVDAHSLARAQHPYAKNVFFPAVAADVARVEADHSAVGVVDNPNVPVESLRRGRQSEDSRQGKRSK